MTCEEILAMEPGRELDALIAEKIMGWKSIITKDEVGDVYRGIPPGGKLFDEDYIPHYSTDIAMAWRVVWKWLRAYYYGTFELNCANFGNETNWECQFGNYPRAKGETAPEAICKAALFTVMKEEGSEQNARPEEKPCDM